MFDSTNYPHDVDYTSKQASKPVITLSAYQSSLESIQYANALYAEKEYQTYQYNKLQAEYNELDGNWAEYLAS